MKLSLFEIFTDFRLQVISLHVIFTCWALYYKNNFHCMKSSQIRSDSESRENVMLRIISWSTVYNNLWSRQHVIWTLVESPELPRLVPIFLSFIIKERNRSCFDTSSFPAHPNKEGDLDGRQLNTNKADIVCQTCITLTYTKWQSFWVQYGQHIYVIA